MQKGSGINKIVLNINSKISVIIGTKERHQIIGRALQSLINQTYQDWECIIVDGSSTKNTLCLVESFNEKRFVYVHLENDPGRIESLNIGIKNSSGSYIAFLDDDDEYMPQKLEKQIKELRTSDNKVGLVYSWTIKYDDAKDNSIQILSNDIKGNVFIDLLERMCLGSFISMLFKREVFFDIGLFQDESNFPSDWRHLCRITKKYEVICIPEVLQLYHINHIYSQISLPKKSDKLYLVRKKNFHINFFWEFRDEYIKNKIIFPVHIISIIELSGETLDINNLFRYYFLAVINIPFNIKLQKTFVKSVIIYFRESFILLKNIICRCKRRLF